MFFQVDKSHPIHIRNDNAKKRRKVSDRNQIQLFYLQGSFACLLYELSFQSQAQMPPPPPEPKPKPEPKEKAKAKAKEETAKAKAYGS